MPEYRTSRARVCVTVGMMTTGYDCTDNPEPRPLSGPSFRPPTSSRSRAAAPASTTSAARLHDARLADEVAEPEKSAFKLFDFFATCEFFETEFNYDEVLQLPQPASGNGEDDGTNPQPVVQAGAYQHVGSDALAEMREETIGAEGMKIDRMLFEKFADTVRADENVAEAVEAGQWDRVIDYVNREVFDKPEEYYSLAKLRKAAEVDRRLTLREILEKVFDLIPRFKSKDELLEDEFAKFVADHKPEQAASIVAIKTLFQGLRHQRLDAGRHRQAAIRQSGHQPGLSPSRTSGPCPRSTATSFPSTSRTTCP